MKKLVLVAMALAMLAGTQSCYFPYNDGFCMSGNGNEVSQDFELNDFNSIENQTVIDVEILQGDQQSVTVEGDQNIIDRLELMVHSNELSIDLKDGCYNNFNLKIYITVPDLEKVSVQSTGDVFLGDFKDLDYLTLRTSSTGDIIGNGELEVTNILELKTSSTGNLKLEAYTNNIIAELSGTGDITLIGSCTDQNIEMNSTGKYNAYNMDSETATVRVSGTGDAKLNVSEQLDVRISGTGDVYYMGTPRINITDNGVGDLIHMN